MRRLAVLALVLLAACSISVEPVRAICRGDSASTAGDTLLVKCSTLDSLANR